MPRPNPETLADLLRLLHSTEQASIRQGQERAATLANADIHDVLLRKTELKRNHVDPNLVKIQSKVFPGLTGASIVLGLLRDAPPESTTAERLRNHIHRLLVDGSRYPFETRLFERLPKLVALDLRNLSLAGKGKAPCDLPELEQISLSKISGSQPLAWLGGAPKLTSLRMRLPSESSVLSGLDALAALTTLELDGIDSLSAMPAMPSLRSLTLNHAPDLKDLSTLTRQPALRSLTLLGNMPGLDWSPLKKCASLRELTVDGTQIAMLGTHVEATLKALPLEQITLPISLQRRLASLVAALEAKGCAVMTLR